MSGESVTICDVMRAVQALAKATATKSKRSSQCFPHLCWNGADCKWLACGSCWFRHCDVKKEVNVLGNENATRKNVNDSKFIDDRLGKAQAMMEKRITELSNYVEKRLAQLEEMMQETLIDEVAELSTRVNTLADSMIENEMKTGRSLDAVAEANVKLAGDIEAEIERKIDEKLDKFLQDNVKASFEAAFTSFAEVMGERVMTIESELAQVRQGHG